MESCTIDQTLSGALAYTLLVLLAVCIPLLVLAPSNKPKIEQADVLGKDPGRFGHGLAKTTTQYNAEGWREALARHKLEQQRPYHVYALDRTILPAKYLPELAWLPDAVVSHRESINKRHLGQYNGMNVALQGRVHADVSRVQLTNSIGVLLPLLNEELHAAIAERLPSTGDNVVVIYDFLFTLIVRMTSRAYVGLPLAHDGEWLRMIEDHPKLMFAVTATLKKWPKYLRPFVAPRVWAKQRLDAYRQRLHEKLEPLIEERRQLSQQPKTQRHVDMLQWLVDTCKGEEATNDNIISKLMFLNLAALHTTASSLTQMILELCQRREYIEPLRKEAETVLGEEEKWTTSALRRLRKMDSFMKETQRLNPQGYFGFARVVMRPFTLADGLHLPPGSSIGIATGMISRDEAYFPDADNFDGNRFLNLRNQPDEPGSDNNNNKDSELQFSGTSPTMMSWGFGRLTCPGRWYAEAQIKLILVILLTKHEFSFPEGQKVRPENVVVGDLLMAPRGQKVSLKRWES